MLSEKELEFALSSAKEATKLAGEILKKYFSKLKNFEEKGISDWVTEADIESEKMIKDFLLDRFPYSFLGEESGHDKGKEAELTWYIDPLDGTKNFVKRIPFFCVSVALGSADDIILGVVYDPINDNMFWAVKGKGAYLNSERIKVSESSDLSKCIVALGLHFKHRQFLEPFLNVYRDVFMQGAGIRHMGSAALEQCYVASGFLDGFLEVGLSPWDVAAGSLIVREANGAVSDFWGGDSWLQTGCLIATNGKIHQEIVRIVKNYFSKI